MWQGRTDGRREGDTEGMKAAVDMGRAEQIICLYASSLSLSPSSSDGFLTLLLTFAAVRPSVLPSVRPSVGRSPECLSSSKCRNARCRLRF